MQREVGLRLLLSRARAELAAATAARRDLAQRVNRAREGGAGDDGGAATTELARQCGLISRLNQRVAEVSGAIEAGVRVGAGGMFGKGERWFQMLSVRVRPRAAAMSICIPVYDTRRAGRGRSPEHDLVAHAGALVRRV